MVEDKIIKWVNEIRWGAEIDLKCDDGSFAKTDSGIWRPMLECYNSINDSVNDYIIRLHNYNI